MEDSARKLVGMRPVGMHRRRRGDDNIKIGLKEIG
jgi:hypothetical protein